MPMLLCLQAATEYGANWPKAWHHWALFNCGLLEALVKQGDTAAARSYVAPAVTGFFRRCVSLFSSLVLVSCRDLSIADSNIDLMAFKRCKQCATNVSSKLPCICIG